MDYEDFEMIEFDIAGFKVSSCIGYVSDVDKNSLSIESPNGREGGTEIVISGNSVNIKSEGDWGSIACTFHLSQEDMNRLRDEFIRIRDAKYRKEE